jgi:hypothetical protein
VRGIPYCWGCMGSLEQIRARIEGGTMAAISAPTTTAHRRRRGRLFGLRERHLGSFDPLHDDRDPSIATRLENAWDLRPGDALNKSGSHVMLFLRFTPDRKAEVMESSTGGCNGKCAATSIRRLAAGARLRADALSCAANDKDMVAQLPPTQKDEPQAKRRRGADAARARVGEDALEPFTPAARPMIAARRVAALDEAQRGWAGIVAVVIITLIHQ